MVCATGGEADSPTCPLQGFCVESICFCKSLCEGPTNFNARDIVLYIDLSIASLQFIVSKAGSRAEGSPHLFWKPPFYLFWVGS